MEKNQLMRFFKLVMGMEMGMRMMRGREGEDFRGGFGEAVC
jgi:hypothetical protein